MKYLKSLDNDDCRHLRKVITNRIDDRMFLLNMDLNDLAEKTGLTVYTLSSIKNGEYSPRIEVLLLICKALKCSLGYIVGPYVNEYTVKND